MPQAASSRWCPTPEQLMILEEMYRGGIRTPNASQIQQITAHLSFYGKIEGKNVFYWFQNHKARDRQKLRRRLSKQQQLQQQQQQMEASASLRPPENPPQFLHQGVGHCMEEAAQVAKPPLTSGREWTAILEMGHSHSLPRPLNNRPLKTLELFPVKSSGTLKEEAAGTSKAAFHA